MPAPWSDTDEQENRMATEQMDALVIFGATGDLAKLETFPALVGLVDRGVLDVPVVGVAKSGWGLGPIPRLRHRVAEAQRHGPRTPAATKMLGMLRYVDGDLDDDATYAGHVGGRRIRRRRVAVLPGGAAARSSVGSPRASRPPTAPPARG